MKLHSSLVEHICAEIIHGLLKDGSIHVEDEQAAVADLSGAIVEDLMVEDRLNEEVREILRTHADEMTRRGVQYHDMFKMIKNELVRKRKLIL